MTAQPADVLGQLSAAGVSVWLDDINRGRLATGGLAARMASRHVVGVTSNPTIFEHALSHGDAYREQLASLAVRGVGVGEASRAITTYDIRWACDVLRPAFDQSAGVDGRVSLEVDPRLADDTDATEVDSRLDKLGTPEAAALRGKAALANARLAYQLYEQKFGTERWQSLQRAGARPQRPLWASTSTKDPAYPDTKYVVELVAPGTVNTMPEATAHAMADHGQLRGDTIHGTYQHSAEVFDELAGLGIGYDDVVQVLETEGVAKFAASWEELIGAIGAELERA